MSKTQKKNLLALSVAALVASSVAAIAGVTTFESDLTGKGVYLGYEMGHDYSGGSSYPGTGYTGGTTGGTTGSATPVAVPTTNVSKYTQCVEICTMDGWKAPGCANGCKEQSGAPSASEAAKTAPKDRCAYTMNDSCLTKCNCAAANYGTPNTAETGTDLNKFFVDGKKILGGCLDICEAAAVQKAAPVPVVETPVPVITPTVEAPPSAGQAVLEEEDQPLLRELRPASDDDFGGGDYEGFGDFGDDFGGKFHGGPGDFGGFDGDFDMGFGGHDEEFMRAMMDQYGGEFSLGEDDFSGYFSDFGPGMGGGDFGFGGEFGGGFGGDEFGGMPYMEGIGEEILGMARGFCPDDVLDEIGQALEDGEFEEIEQLMMEGCMGGGEFGGPMEDPSEIVGTLRAMTEGIDLGLGVLEENGFDKDVASDVRGLLAQVNAAADEAEEACDEDLFGLSGLLAQIFDDEEEDDEEFEEDDEDEDFDDEDDDFFGDDEEGGACREAIEKAFYLMDPDSDEEYPKSVRGIMQPAIEDFFRNLHEEDEAKSREVFAAFMKHMAPVVVGDEMELSDEDIDNMYDMLVENDFNFDAVGNPHAAGGEWEANFDNEDDFGSDFREFDEEEFEEEDQPLLRELRPASEGGKAGGGGFGGNEEGGEEEEEFSDEYFDF